MDDANGHSISAMSDAELIAEMRHVDCCPVRLKSVRTEFYTRYVDGLHAHCAYVHGSRLASEDDRIELVDNIFVAFFQTGIARFNTAVARSEKDMTKLIRFWLAKKARWMLDTRSVNVTNRETTLIDPDTIRVSGGNQDDECCARLSAQQRQLKRPKEKLSSLLQRMDEKERDILITSFGYYDVERDTFLVPRDVRSHLCERWGFRNHNSLVKFRRRKVAWIKEQMTERVQVA